MNINEDHCMVDADRVARESFLDRWAKDHKEEVREWKISSLEAKGWSRKDAEQNVLFQEVPVNIIESMYGEE